MKISNILQEMAVFCIVSCFAAHVPAGEPSISEVTVHQRWPWSPLVDIDYSLACDNTQQVDIAVAGYHGESALDLPSLSLSGDLFRQTNGTHRIIWDPTQTVYTNSGALTKFSVGLTPSLAPTYMIVDLTKSAGDAGQTVYVTASDLASGAYGTVATNPVDGIQSVVWTEVTNRTEYMTTKMVFRRVPAGTFSMGGSKSVTLTKDFYIGVFEVTQAQWTNVMNSGWTSFYFTNQLNRAIRPAENFIAYSTLRGATNDTPAVNWPSTGTTVTPTSFMGKLRTKTGFSSFDLPTEAQWEYACRAGTATVFNDNDTSANLNTSNWFTNQWLDAVGRYRYNGGWLNGADAGRSYAEYGSAQVGSYRPNAWGLYDMHGNIFEWCLDWYADTLSGGTDPVGPAWAAKRVRRGGSWSHDAGICASGNRLAQDDWGSSFLGFRIVRNLP